MGLRTNDSSSKKSEGLAILLQQDTPVERSSVHLEQNGQELENALKYVLNVEQSTSSLVQTGRINFSAVDSVLHECIAELKTGVEWTQTEGCLGPAHVELDMNSVYGELHRSIEEGPFTVESHANFSSCRATNCYFTNCWMYEAILCTSGIQQIGWATLSCQFNNEEGVGDAKDSYAFDGNRVQKWNTKASSYGESWAPGDVIGCCADFTKGEISFYRNGKSMGIAFSEISVLKPDLGYFPAISLSLGERCTLNFGSKPFFYPITGFHPCQSAPSDVESNTVQYLMSCLERLSDVTSCVELLASSPSQNFPRCKLRIDEKVLMAGAVLQILYPYLRKDYHLVKSLIPCLKRLTAKMDTNRTRAVVPFLELLASTLGLDEFTQLMRRLYENLASLCCVSSFKASEVPFTASYPHLNLLLSMLGLPLAKQLFIQHPRFHFLMEKCLTRKQPTDEDLKELLPNVWWKGCKYESMTEDIMMSLITTLSNALRKIEEVQFELFILIFHQSSSAFNEELFFEFVQYLLKKNAGAGRNVLPPGLSDTTVMVSFFNLLVKLMRPHLVMRTIEGINALEEFPVEALFVKDGLFLGDYAFHDLPRLGGLYSHLLKEVEVEGSKESIHVLMEPDMFQADNPSFRLPKNLVSKIFHTVLLCYRLGVDTVIKNSAQQFQIESSARSLLIKMENKQKNSEFKEQEREQFNVELQNQRIELIKAIRQSSWSKIVLFTPNKQKSIFLFTVYLSKLILSISKTGNSALFQFIPEVYMEAILDLFQALAKMDPRFGNLIQMEIFGLQSIFSLLVMHFDNPLILNPQISDSMLQTLAIVFSDKELMRSCERSPDAKTHLIPRLIRAFDSRHWLSVTNIFLSIGKGTGFGHGSTTSGSPVFREIFQTVGNHDMESLTSFINRLFNTLNWTLTELALALGEWAQILNVMTNYAQENALLARQSRKASVLFNLAVNLLRLMELVAARVPNVFLIGSRMNIMRVVEVLGYVLSHTSEGPNSISFNTILNSHLSFSGQDAKFRISRLSILAPVAGIMVSLHSNSEASSSRKLDLDHSIAKVLAEEVACPINALHSLLTIDWKPSYANISKGKWIPRLKDLMKALDQARKELNQKANQERQNFDEIPEEFVDPILMTIMKDPVILPDSKVVVDRETIERTLLTNPTDPFSRAPLTVDMLKPDTVLKEKIRKWTMDDKSTH
eukprot:g4018.t1